jgi:hypothetical protein
MEINELIKLRDLVDEIIKDRQKEGTNFEVRDGSLQNNGTAIALVYTTETGGNFPIVRTTRKENTELILSNIEKVALAVHGPGPHYQCPCFHLIDYQTEKIYQTLNW